MSRQQFNSRNNIGKVFTFQKSGSTSSFNPNVNFLFPSSKRVSWRLDNGLGIEQIAGNSLIYTGFTSDSNIRNIELRSSSFKNITDLLMFDDKLYGHINLSVFNESPFENGSVLLNNNVGITGITNPSISINSAPIFNYSLSECNIIGDLNMTSISGDINSFIVYSNPNLTSITFSNTTNITSQFVAYNCNIIGNLNAQFSGTSFQVQSNNKLTGITHNPSSKNINFYNASSCNLKGTVDLSPLSGLGGSFYINSNSGITNIYHSPSINNFNIYSAYDCNLTNNLDLTMLSGFGGLFFVYNNSNLTGISHTYSSNDINQYNASICNLIGNLNLNMFPNLGGRINLMSNLLLTGITHTASTRVFSEYNVSQCNLIGNYDISMLKNLGGQINFSQNSLLTGLTFTSASTESVIFFNISACNIQGNINLSSFTGIGSTLSGVSSQIKINANSGLTSVIFPDSNGLYYRNITNSILNAAFGMYTCSLGYVDFKPLSGSTLISGTTVGIPRFELFGNRMTTAEVNHILSDFDLISTLNYSGWTSTSGTSGAYVDISGNSAPDGSSGGYNGTGATINLISKGWTIITD